jgi:UDP-GlcNAc3NAcA epimerase
MQITSIVGARPQFIKAAVVSHALMATNLVEETLIHTGQHYDNNMSAVFFQELGIPVPDLNLSIGSGPHGRQTGQMLGAIEEILFDSSPDWVLVYGDTNSTIAGALAAAKLHIPVAHVEAGLRSFNRKMPEEINRVLTDHLSDMLFVPTQAAVNNLRKEGIPDDKVELVGDVMFDAVLHYGAKAEEESTILERVKVLQGNYILTTIHRAENTDDLERLSAIFNGLSKIASDIPVVFPLHPRTRSALIKTGLYFQINECIKIMEPVGYLDMMMLEKNATLMVTDSGGMQKEAFFHKIPCVTLRDETEWVELVDLGWNVLISPLDENIVYQGVLNVLKGWGASTKTGENLYGGGKAAEKIAQLLLT